MLTMTERAVQKVQSFMEAEASAKGKSLRVSLRPSGCAGYEYLLGFDVKKDGDVVLPQSGFDVLVDPQSHDLISEATIDFEEGSMGSGFKISNPKERGSCGCGKSKQF